MIIRRVVSYIVFFIGSLFLLIGLALVALYVYGAIIARWGESDQSLLFWHLPLLFFGLLSFASGLAASLWGVNRIRTSLEMENSNAA